MTAAAVKSSLKIPAALKGGVPWLVLLAAVLGAAATAAGFWAVFLGIAPAFGYDFWAVGPAAFVLVIAWGLGLWWWGRLLDSENSLAPVVAAFLMLTSAGLWQAGPWLFELSMPLEALIYPDSSPQAPWRLWAARTTALLAPLGLAGFLASGVLPALAQMGLSHKRGFNQQFTQLYGCWLLGLALGSLIPFGGFWAADPKILGFVAFVPAAAAAGLILYAGRTQEGGLDWRLRFWPSHFLGLWSGATSYGLDQDLTKRMAKPAWLAVFLGGFAGLSGLGLWGGYFVLFGPFDTAAVWGQWAVTALLGLALGAFFVAPLLTRMFGPMPALGLALLMQTAAFWAGPTIMAQGLAATGASWFFGRPGLWFVLCPLAAFGALWPLAVRIFQARRTWVGVSLAQAGAWLAAGAVFGLLARLLLGGLFGFTFTFKFLSVVSAAGAALAFAPAISWVLAFAALGGASFFIIGVRQPLGFKADFVPGLVQAGLPQGQVDAHADGPAGYVTVIKYAGHQYYYRNGLYIIDDTPGRQRPWALALALSAIASRVDDQPQEKGIGLALATFDLGGLAPEVVTAFGFDLVAAGRVTSGPEGIFNAEGQGGVQPVLDNGGHYLSLTQTRFNLIVAGPVDGPGRKSRFERGPEFFALMSSKLTPGGAAALLIEAESFSQTALLDLVTHFRGAFPGAKVWRVGEKRLLVLGGQGGLADEARIKSAADEARFAGVLKEHGLSPQQITDAYVEDEAVLLRELYPQNLPAPADEPEQPQAQ